VVGNVSSLDSLGDYHRFVPSNATLCPSGWRKLRYKVGTAKVKKNLSTEESRAFWRVAEDASFQVEETERLNLPYTRFGAYIKGFEDGYRQRDEEDDNGTDN